MELKDLLKKKMRDNKAFEFYLFIFWGTTYSAEEVIMS